MDEKRRKIWDKKYSLKRNLTDNEIKEFDYLVIMGSNNDTCNDIEYHRRLYDFINSIIYNNDIDYISKLDKLKTFTDTNKSLKLYSQERWEF